MACPMWLTPMWLTMSLKLMTAAVLPAVIVLISCADDGSDADLSEERALESVRGFVLDVEAESLISLTALSVQDDEGKVWRFEGQGKVVPGFTPSHLNEHKLLGQSVLVAFYREGEALVLHDITD